MIAASPSCYGLQTAVPSHANQRPVGTLANDLKPWPLSQSLAAIRIIKYHVSAQDFAMDLLFPLILCRLGSSILQVIVRHIIFKVALLCLIFLRIKRSVSLSLEVEHSLAWLLHIFRSIRRLYQGISLIEQLIGAQFTSTATPRDSMHTTARTVT